MFCFWITSTNTEQQTIKYNCRKLSCDGHLFSFGKISNNESIHFWVHFLHLQSWTSHLHEETGSADGEEPSHGGVFVEFMLPWLMLIKLETPSSFHICTQQTAWEGGERKIAKGRHTDEKGCKAKGTSRTSKTNDLTQTEVQENVQILQIWEAFIWSGY